jgi:outer membrane receptor protein involved in Fe transport
VPSTGFFRQFDIVVEAHLDDGTSSAGGNFRINTRNGVSDSTFSNNAGYDILTVNNPAIPTINLTRPEQIWMLV